MYYTIIKNRFERFSVFDGNVSKIVDRPLIELWQMQFQAKRNILIGRHYRFCLLDFSVHIASSNGKATFERLLRN